VGGETTDDSVIRIGGRSCSVIADVTQDASPTDEVDVEERADSGGRPNTKRRKVSLETGSFDLKEPLRLWNVFEVVLTEVAKREGGRLMVFKDPGRDIRDHDLATAPGRADASSPADPDADVPVPMEKRLSRMEPDPDAEHPAGRKRPLRSYRRPDRIERTSKDDKEGIALRFELMPVMHRKRLP
jgi:hypothetical protein